MTFPLTDIRVVEMAGLAPAPFAGMVLADFGAQVVRIDRAHATTSTDVLARHKRSLALDLKQPVSINVLRTIIRQSDIILDPFRPGVMEKLGLGPNVLLADNSRLVYARLCGFGQSGQGTTMAGHDINYLAIAGTLNMLGHRGQPPTFPINLLADFAGGGLMCVMGILMALVERSRSGKGQVIDANLTAGTAYLTTFPYLMQKHHIMFDQERGSHLLDGGAPFYGVYKTKDGRYMAVGALEPQFYSQLLMGLGIDTNTTLADQYDTASWPAMKGRFSAVFETKTQAEWTRCFDGVDACVTPVLSFRETVPNDHVTPFVAMDRRWPRRAIPPQPAPSLSRTPARLQDSSSNDTFLLPGAHSVEVLKEHGLSPQYIHTLLRSGAVTDAMHSTSLL